MVTRGFDSPARALTDTDVIVHATRLPGTRPLALDGYRVFHPVAKGPHDYHAAFARLWDGGDLGTGSAGTIVNVEHDMEVSPPLVAELLACPHALCTHAYLMHIPRTYYAHSTRADAMDGFWIGQGDEWAAYSAIGFCKVAASARVRPLARTVWRGVELEVNNAVTGRWHVHWPGVFHDHEEPRDGEE